MAKKKPHGKKPHGKKPHGKKPHGRIHRSKSGKSYVKHEGKWVEVAGHHRHGPHHKK